MSNDLNDPRVATPATLATPTLPARWTSPAWLLSALAAWLLCTPGLRPLLVPDEGRYAEVARAMYQGGHAEAWLVPTLNGLPFFHKPPLFYWIDAAAMRAFGAVEFAGRFGSAIGAWVMGATLFFAMRRWHGPRTAAIALGLLATTPFFFLGGQYANLDMLVGGLITAAVLALARSVDEPPAVDRRWLVAGWALCGLAMLAKGLIGIVLPALVIGPWLIAQGRRRQLPKLLHPLGLIAFAVVGLPWFAAMEWRYPGFLGYFVVEQHFHRFAQSTFNGVHGAWFFLAVLPLATLPWSLRLPAAIRRVMADRSPAVTLCAWWTIAVVGFFSIPASKLIGYALPALAPWCALLAVAVAESPRGTVRWRWAAGASALVCVAVVALAGWMTPRSNRALASTLANTMAPADPVVMVGEYHYDVPFYARLKRPVIIAGDWADPDLPLRDNWRKEIFDAAGFDPALGRALLQPMAALGTMACGTSPVGAVWFIVSAGQAAPIAGQPGAVRVFADARTELWRVPGRSCRT